jgi:hypothetical protein
LNKVLATHYINNYYKEAISFNFKNNDIVNIGGIDSRFRDISNDVVGLQLKNYNDFNKLLNLTKENKLKVFNIKLNYYK